MSALESLAHNLQDPIVEALTTAVRDLVEGTGADLQVYGRDLVRHAALAIAAGDLKLKAELGHQALLLLEKHRLRVAKKDRAMFLHLVDTLLQFAVKAAGVAALTLIP